MSDSARNLEIVYESLSSAAKELEGAAAPGVFGCPPGCGLCCVGFDPLVTRPELDYLAAWLADKPEFDGLVFAPRKTAQQTCRFYRPASPFHCAVYPARPLVCRTFAYTSTPDKTGNPVFAFCRHMPSGAPRKLLGPEIRKHLGSQVPSSRDAGVAVSALDPAAGLVPLAEAIGPALRLRRWKNGLDPEDRPEPPQIPPQAA